jgi:hypothetical protein
VSDIEIKDDDDIIGAMLPEKAAALVFYEDGSMGLMIPKAEGREQVPENVLAATEMLFRIEERDPAVAELAEAFSRRVSS